VTKRSSNRRPFMFAAAVFFLSTAVCAAPDAHTKADPYRRLGGPDHLVELRALETHALDFEKLADLESWSGDPITAESLKGRVLILLAWDQHEARSVRLLPTLSRLNRTLKDKAVCLAVHSKDGWDDAKERIAAGRVPIATAHDTDGSFFEMLRVDEHPNLFIVDKAGQIRIADLDPRDLTRAVNALSRETPEQARADLPRRIELFAQASRLTVPSDMPNPDAAPQQTTPSTPGRPVRSVPSNPVEPQDEIQPAAPRPPASAYSAAAWPEINRQGINATNIQGKRLPVALGNENWLTERPERALNEHVMILDFWATWCGPCIRASPTLDRLQIQYKGDLLVMGISGQSAGSRYPEDERAIRSFIAGHPVSYSHLHDAQQRVYRSLRITGIPHVLVISTDGIIRWQGNPLDANFQRAVDSVVRADPLLAARRAQQPRNGKPNG